MVSIHIRERCPCQISRMYPNCNPTLYYSLGPRVLHDDRLDSVLHDHCRHPAAAATAKGAEARAATGPEPAALPGSAGPAAGGGRPWGRGNKNTVSFPIAEQDRYGQAARRDDQEPPRSRSNKRDKYKDIKE
jgi:hypothetical protein